MTGRPIATVFGSGRSREADAHYSEARRLGAELAAKSMIVCTGGYGGVMEAVSRGAKEAGGRTIGVTSEFFSSRANKWVDEEVRVKTWQDRLFELLKLGSGYVACAGGTGTLAEIAVVWEMLNKGAMAQKPLVVLGDFWQPVIECVRKAEGGRASGWDERGALLVHVARSPADAAAYLAAHFRAR
jgi:uncharacterized protein (TIGR00725 family)